MLSIDPITPLYQYGVPTGAAIISVGLFIWSKIEASITKKTSDETRNISERSLEVLTKLADHVISMESTMLQLVRDQQAGLQRILESQSVIITHQTNLGQSTHKLMESLIDILGEVKG